MTINKNSFDKVISEKQLYLHFEKQSLEVFF